MVLVVLVVLMVLVVIIGFGGFDGFGVLHDSISWCSSYRAVTCNIDKSELRTCLCT